MTSATVHGLEYLGRALRELDEPDGPGALQLSIHTAAVVDQPLFSDVVGASVRAEGGTSVVAKECEAEDFVKLTGTGASRVIDHCRDLATSIDVALATARVSGLKITAEPDPRGGVRFLANGSATPHPGAHVRILGVLKALAVLCGSGSEVGALVYSDEGLDGDHAAALWNFLCGHVPSLGLCGPRRLLVVLDTPSLHPTVYYAKPTPIQCQVDASGCHRRWGSRETARQADRLVSLSEPGQPLVLFLGAGASFSSGLPLGNTLRNQALRRLLSSRSLDERLPYEFFAWLKDKGNTRSGEESLTPKAFADSLTLERVLREEFAMSGGRRHSATLAGFDTSNVGRIGKEGKAVLGLRRLVATLPSMSDRRVVLITLNFDTLLEHGHGGNLKIYKSDADFNGAHGGQSAAEYIEEYKRIGGPVPYLKLHGSIEDRSSVVASVVQTEGGLPKGKSAALRALYGVTRPTPLVYVGCSMRDHDLAPLTISPEWTEGFDERWVSPLMDESVRRFVAAYRLVKWQAAATREDVDALLFDDRAITDTADNFVGDLLAAFGC